jgi:flagellar biosynthesis protein FlhF
MGPPGVGKTTTIAKLSGFHSIRGRDIGIIALEDDRICALRKAEIFAKIINIPMEVAAGRDGMQRALRRFRGKEIVYIDTPGAGIGDAAGIRAIREPLADVPDLQNQLLISAAAKDRDMAELARSFSEAPIHGLIITKLDESIAYGDLLNYLYRSPMPLSYFADGQQVPEDIGPATPQRLAGLFTNHDAPAAASNRPAAASDRPTESEPPAGAEDPDSEDPFEGLRYYGGGM